jgi:hypothetical protein
MARGQAVPDGKAAIQSECIDLMLAWLPITPQIE